MIDERLLEEKLVEIEKARSWSPRLIAKLEALIRSPEDFSLFRVNPLQFGTERNIPEPEAIDLFLYGAKLGLFQMNWHLLCPQCGQVVESFGTLRAVHAHYHCELCREDFEATLDDYIEVSFTITPAIREIAFHHPESLSIEDYYFKYHFSQGGLLPDGTKFVDWLKSSVKILTYLEPGGKRAFEFEIPAGFLLGYDWFNHAKLLFPVTGDPGTAVQRVAVELVNGHYAFEQEEFSPGKILVECENHTDKRGALLLAHCPPFPPGYVPEPLQFQPFLSGKRLFTTQAFRDLFRLETIQGTEGLGVRDLTVVFTDLKGSTELYEQIGDLKAFALVQQHFERLGKAVQQCSGAIVKTIGDAIMATFLNPVDATKASLSMLEEIEQFNQEHGARVLILKVGIHKGATIAVTLNDRLDYFGQTINIASRVSGLAGADEIYVTYDVYTHPGVQELLRGFQVSSADAKLKGIQKEMQVYKIAAS